MWTWPSLKSSQPNIIITNPSSSPELSDNDLPLVPVSHIFSRRSKKISFLIIYLVDKRWHCISSCNALLAVVVGCIRHYKVKSVCLKIILQLHWMTTFVLSAYCHFLCLTPEHVFLKPVTFLMVISKFQHLGNDLWNSWQSYRLKNDQFLFAILPSCHSTLWFDCD